MSAAPAKFNFDLDMAVTPQKKSRVLSEETLQTMLDTARTEGYAQGFTEGQQSEISKASKDVNSAAQTIVTTAKSLIGGVDAMEKDLRGNAVSLAASIARKLASNLMSGQPEVELKELLVECLASLETAPHLLIRCNPALTDKLQEIAEPLVATSGYAGRLIIMGDPEIGLSDGRMEWSDGGIVRNTTEIDEKIDASIQAYLESHGISPLPIALESERDS